MNHRQSCIIRSSIGHLRNTTSDKGTNLLHLELQHASSFSLCLLPRSLVNGGGRLRLLGHFNRVKEARCRKEVMPLSRRKLASLWIVLFLGGRYQPVAFAPRPIGTTPARRQQHTTIWNAKKAPNDTENASKPDDICETVKAAFSNLQGTIQDAFKSLTELALQDYKWRSSVFKNNEADRLMEQSLARMQGKDASYVRPMDAADEKIGPLGRAERTAVSWISKVIEEEGKRAESIVKADGKLVRPIDATDPDDDDLGPLAALEKKATDFFDSIRESERERVVTRTLRPKDVEESKRGPLGEAEARAVATLQEIQESERLRCRQSQVRGGDIVRPIDVPGPLGDMEMAVAEVIRAEKQRVKDREKNLGMMVRPKDATLKGPLGDAELGAVEAFQRLNEEERERLRNIQRLLQEKRPMESERESLLGLVEATVVGILRAPRMLMSVVERVQELMLSEALEDTDQKRLTDKSTRSSRKGDGKGKRSD